MHICVSSTICKIWSNWMLLCIPVQFICTSALSGWQLNITQICTFLQMHMFIEEVGYLCRVHICAICMKYSHVRAQLHIVQVRLYIKWSATHAHVHRNSIGDEVVGYLCPFIHRSPIQCGVTLDSVWHTMIHTMIHCGTLWYTLWYTLAHFLILHTLALDTGTLNPVWRGSRPLRHNTPSLSWSTHWNQNFGNTKIISEIGAVQNCSKVCIASCSCT